MNFKLKRTSESWLGSRDVVKRTIEINTLEELISLMRQEDNWLVIGFEREVGDDTLFIEIYDDYRE